MDKQQALTEEITHKKRKANIIFHISDWQIMKLGNILFIDKIIREQTHSKIVGMQESNNSQGQELDNVRKNYICIYPLTQQSHF